MPSNYLRQLLLASASVMTFASVSPALAQEATEAEAAPAAAEPEADQSMKLTTVTVTAQRREESANDVPMAIQAFGAEQMDTLRVNSVDDLQSLVPSFTVSQSYQGVPTYTLRGIGFNTINMSATSTVGTYVDEVAYPYPIMNSGPVFDIERIEVLKGPQGTLFGRNTTAGLFNVVTNKPSEEFEASLKADLGNYQTFNYEGMMNLPISDTFQARFAFRQETSAEGWQKSMSHDETRGKVDKTGYRLALAWQPTPMFDVDFSYNGWLNKSDTLGGQAIGLTPNTNPFFIVPGTNGPSTASGFLEPGLLDFIQNNQPTSGEDADWAPRARREATVGGVPGLEGPLEEDSRFDAVKLGLNYEFDNGMRVVSLTGYNKLERESMLDWSGAPFQILTQDIDGEIESLSQEIRLEGETGIASWLVGAYYGKDEITDSNQTNLRDNANSNFVSTAAYLLTVDPTQLGFPPEIAGLVAAMNIDPETGAPYTAAELLNSFQTYYDIGEFETTTWSIFANADWDISPELTLTTGVRYTEDSQDYVGCSGDINGSMQPNVNVFNRVFFTGLYGLAVPPAALEENGCNTYSETNNAFGPVVSDLTEDNVSWRVVANYTPERFDDLLLFASVSQGYKGASVPVNAASKAEQNFPATQESLLAYELGVKAGLLNGRMQANASVFYYDYEDKQVSTYFPDPIYRALSQLQNAPSGKAYGFDGELTWLVFDSLTAIAGATFLHTEYGSFETFDTFGTPINREGDPFLYSPEETLSLSLIYDREVSPNWGLEASLSGRWQSDSTASSPDDELYDIDAYGTLNGSIGLYTLDDKWKVSLWGKNLTDEYYWQQVISNANTVIRFAGKPRTFGLSLSYTY
ncbi:TonB-dependent receptor [Ponticaulis profundi]|uniref:TonB-dependent receptor n=1 Tax=Ponticaulis profundi TaxID=2665222 RepID=A0ABW1S616_9PROT